MTQELVQCTLREHVPTSRSDASYCAVSLHNRAFGSKSDLKRKPSQSLACEDDRKKTKHVALDNDGTSTYFSSPSSSPSPKIASSGACRTTDYSPAETFSPQELLRRNMTMRLDLATLHARIYELQLEISMLNATPEAAIAASP
ncbi:hypothetical protein NM688_g5180 [Phlebia brevispora]|uniref:Uncharacterized protein n=1 Tax=Phlebia brevispora TaxID=194682 RepID=A0ACC1SZ24_9APHY|nr:hypothetical protein NM688_g5180 [Phlebia brevispora]